MTRRGCPTGKRRYTNSIEALQSLTRKKKRGRSESGYYKCKHCERWHLTSQDPVTIGMTWNG